MSNQKVLKYINRTIVILPFVLVVWLAYRNVIPTGKLHIHFDANKTESAAIKNFAASEPDVILGRDTKTGESYRLITQDSVNFDVKVPKPFKQATVKVVYQNPQGQTNLAVGAVQKAGGYYFRTAALYDERLENLPSYWQLTRSDGLVLYQRDRELADLTMRLDVLRQAFDQNNLDNTGPTTETADRSNEIQMLKDQIASHQSIKTYASISSFLNQLPDPKRVITYGYDITGSAVLPDYQPVNRESTINIALRGSHEFFTYIKNEPFTINIASQEINRKAGADTTKIEVFHGSEKVYSVTVPEDDNISADGVAGPVNATAINLPNLPEGVYRLAYTTKDDETLIRSITTRQKYLVMSGHVYPADNIEYSFAGISEHPTTLYTDSQKISVSTAHNNGFQEVRFGNQVGTIDKIRQNLSLEKTSQGALDAISLPRNDVTINGHYFVFSPEQYFDPRMGSKEFGEITTSQLNDYDFIIGNYPVAQKAGDWLVASQTIAVPQLYTEKGTIRMALNAPELKNNRRILKIKSIDIDLERDPLTLARVVDKLRSKLHL